MTYTPPDPSQDKVHENYLDIPCANCGLHYWKIPFKKCELKLKCPKCREVSSIVIGDTLRIVCD